jgi:hypothetical protein
VPTRKPPAPARIEIDPLLTYRLLDPVAVYTTGLAPEQQKQAAERGELAGELPFRLTATGNFAWLGQQLLNIQAARLATVRARAKQLATERASASDKPAELKQRSRKRKAAA